MALSGVVCAHRHRSSIQHRYQKLNAGNVEAGAGITVDASVWRLRIGHVCAQQIALRTKVSNPAYPFSGEIYRSHVGVALSAARSTTRMHNLHVLQKIFSLRRNKIGYQIELGEYLVA
jgi:hypothetical protein